MVRADEQLKMIPVVVFTTTTCPCYFPGDQRGRSATTRRPAYTGRAGYAARRRHDLTIETVDLTHHARWRMCRSMGLVT